MFYRTVICFKSQVVVLLFLSYYYLILRLFKIQKMRNQHEEFLQIFTLEILKLGKTKRRNYVYYHLTTGSIR